METKKVLIISYYWPPSGGAGVQRCLKFVKYLSLFGWEPFVLTVDELKASYPLLDETLLNDIPAGTRILKTDSFEPLNILTRITGNKAPYSGFTNKDKENLSQKILRFVRGNFFIPDARRGWVKHATKKAIEIIKKEKINTVVISSPPHSSQLIGLKLKKSFPSMKWIADMRDPWTDIYYYKDLLHTTLASGIDKNYERKVLETADEVVVVSEDIKRIFASKSDKLNAAKIHVIPNGYDEPDFTSAEKPVQDKFVIGYIGTMTNIYKPGRFLYAISKLIKNHPESVIQLLFVGNVDKEVMEILKKYDLLACCNFVPHVSHPEAISYMKQCSILFLAIPDTKSNKGILTGKLFEYMAAQRPILCLGPEDGDAAKIIRETNAGVVCNYDDDGKIEKTLANYFERYQSGKLEADSVQIDRYSRRNLTKQFVTLLDKITA